MTYRENPKLKGSGILACIPQKGRCPNGCADCFFQSGRSYLEPLVDNLPNMPTAQQAAGRVVRVNDGNDSNVGRAGVVAAVQGYPMRFYNTAIPKDLGGFDAPVVLTLNPGGMTDEGWHRLDPVPPNLMFVRFRVNTWNLHLADEAVEYYSEQEVPIVLTFMAYFTAEISSEYQADYIVRKRTMNTYAAITTAAWEGVMARYRYCIWVSSCGKIEGEKGTTGCRYCGNCLREYFATMERLKGE